MLKSRHDGRVWNQSRTISVTYDVQGTAHGSVLFKLGNTQVLCSVTMQSGVPAFLRGKGKGWLTAEYAMLPASTFPRSPRESSVGKRDGRSVEISRLIGRSLRAILNLDLLGERTLYVDCDVIQADGGTRSAAITGAYCALRYALINKKFPFMPEDGFLQDSVGALSVGISHEDILLDLNFNEDISIDADFNFVMTGSGNIIEIQGATESMPIEWKKVQLMQELAARGIIDMLKTLS